MRKIVAVGLVAVFVLSVVSWSMAAPPQQTSNPKLHLHRGTFDAQQVTQLAPMSALAVVAPGPYAIIQLRGPVTAVDRTALEQTGIKLLEYLPDYAYLVQGTPAQLDAAARLPQVYARTSFTLADKLAPALLRAIARGDTELGQVRIIGWPDDQGPLKLDLQAIGVQKLLTPAASQLLQIANLVSVRWIEPVTQPRLFNDRARTIMGVDPLWQNRQLFGTGQTIAVADSGLDTGNPAALSPDFLGRLVATHVVSTVVSDWGDQFGHGTHVAGSVAGAGIQSGANPSQRDYAGSFAGVAPEAKLVIQAFDALPDGTVVGLDPDYYNLFAQAYADGARLHTNSWGDPTGPSSDPEATYGGYPFGAQRTDQMEDYKEVIRNSSFIGPA